MRNGRLETINDKGSVMLMFLCRYFFDNMTPDEVLLIKLFDTANDGKTAKRTPHSAFVKSGTENEPKRESIEIRCLAFFEDQPL